MEKLLKRCPGATASAAAVTALESMPPLRKMPTGTSLTRRWRTDAHRESQSASAHAVGSRGGAPLARPRAEGQVPVPVEANPARGHGERVPGGKLPDARQDGGGIGQVAAGEVAREALQIEIAADLGMGEQGPDFRGEHEPPVALRVVEGLFPHPIAGGEERLALGVPQDEGEHPVEMGEAIRAELLPGVDDHLGVGAGGEAVPARAQGLGEAPEIVDLAVEHGVDGARLVGDRAGARWRGR